MTFTSDVENSFFINYFEFQQMEYALTFKLLFKKTNGYTFHFSI